MSEPTQSFVTTHLNEAAYYVSCGAKIIKIEIKEKWHRKYADARKIKQEMWKFELEDVPSNAIDEWWLGTASMNIRRYMEARSAVKRQVYTFKYGKKVNKFLEHI